MKKRTAFLAFTLISLVAIGLVTTKAKTKFATYYYQANGKNCAVITGLECGVGSLNCVELLMVQLIHYFFKELLMVLAVLMQPKGLNRFSLNELLIKGELVEPVYKKLTF